MKVYLDNAATTPLDPEVLEAMLPFMTEHFGNPSSTHSFGRKTKDAIETARRTVASFLHCQPSEITFTSGGTEADNIAIYDAIHSHGVKNIILSKVEHHAVLDSSINFKKLGINALFVNLDEKGVVDLKHLETLLTKHKDVLVSLMHANNEIANLLPLQQVAEICRKHNALFHSDTVQSMAHYAFDLSSIDIDYITGSAHKFHGPKGVGFLYHKKKKSFAKIIHGGSQERDHRSGTENLYGIIGLAKAMEIAYNHLEDHQNRILSLKNYMIEQLKDKVSDVRFNGESADESLYTVLSINLPDTGIGSMLLFSLDLEGIAASGGSACASGSDKGSHVLEQIPGSHHRLNVRFSFSKMNTKEEIDYVVETLSKIMDRGN